MRTVFDFSPYYRDSVGFDRIFGLLDAVAGQTGTSPYPPYDIEKIGQDAYRIVMAVAGLDEAELDITQKENELLVTGKARPAPEVREYLYRGIGPRDFERRFQLADYVKVVGAKLARGMLSIDLVRELPEEKKARDIPVETASGQRAITQQ